MAAILSPENFVRLVQLCGQFVKRPSENFFFRSIPKPNITLLARLMKARQTRFAAIIFKAPDLIPDILLPQLRRTAARIRDILHEYQFAVLGHDVWANGDCVMLFELEIWQLPAVRKLHGPNIFTHNRAEEFIKKYRPLGRLYVEGDHWVAEIERKFRTAQAKLEDSLSVDVKELLAKGFASHISKAIAAGFKLLDEKQILALARREPLFGAFLTDYFKKDYRV